MSEPRIGVYICWCGTNISKMVDVVKLSEDFKKVKNVVVSKDYKYMCSDPGQEILVKDIKEYNLNRIVIASCSPRMHELTFRRAVQNAGLNQYMVEVANIREHVAWVHSDYKAATDKARELILAAVERVAHHEPLEKREVEINQSTLVIGGGITGITAALEIADAGKKVYLVEKSEKLGGMMKNLDLTFPYLDSAVQLIEPLLKNLITHPNISVYLESEVKDVKGFVGSFYVQICSKHKLKEGSAISDLTVGNIIVATGLKTFNPAVMSEYGYSQLPNVITSVEFEKNISKGNFLNKEGREIEHAVIIHCVGSRSKEYNQYCSRVCCMNSLKYANQLRNALPDLSIYEMYADMRAFGKGCEELYSDTSRKNIMFLMFEKEDLPKIRRAKKNESFDMVVEINDVLSQETLEVPADLVILSVAMEASEDAKEIAHLVGISMDQNKFFIEKHPKLDPVATTTDGVYIAGSCHGPKDISDCITQGNAAAVRVLSTICRGKVQVEVITSAVNEAFCCGCHTCIKVCPYGAVGFNTQKGVSEVNEILCKGCGTCTSTCPAGAIRSKHFTDRQIIAQIEGLMSLSAH